MLKKYKYVLNKFVDKVDNSNLNIYTLFSSDKMYWNENEIIKFKGVLYRPVSHNPNIDVVFLEKLENQNLNFNEDFNYLDNHPTCPICGYVEYDSSEFEDGDEYECPQCQATLSIEIEVQYNTTVVKKPKITRIN